ncbi:MAG: hypothetical protein JWM75_1114 [Sphingomonas bacterium]|nr:hypothetical protein [Sphingomonas bacterium]
MFLHRCVDLNPTFDKKSLGNIDQVRDAKGKVREIIGRRYNEPKDQPVLTKMINFPALYQKSRSYAKLCKEVSGMCYSELDKLSNDLCPSEY